MLTEICQGIVTSLEYWRQTPNTDLNERLSGGRTPCFCLHATFFCTHFSSLHQIFCCGLDYNRSFAHSDNGKCQRRRDLSLRNHCHWLPRGSYLCNVHTLYVLVSGIWIGKSYVTLIRCPSKCVNACLCLGFMVYQLLLFPTLDKSKVRAWAPLLPLMLHPAPLMFHPFPHAQPQAED